MAQLVFIDNVATASSFLCTDNKSNAKSILTNINSLPGALRSSTLTLAHMFLSL